MSDPNWTKCIETAQTILAQHPVTEPPIDVFQQAEDKGIEIVYFKPTIDQRDISGLLDKDQKRIYLNVNDGPERQSFTIAHELGHYVLGHSPDEYGVYRRNALWDETKPSSEREADKFAAELLMPKNLIISSMKRYGLSKADASTLATLFGVSQPAMTFRLKSI